MLSDLFTSPCAKEVRLERYSREEPGPIPLLGGVILNDVVFISQCIMDWFLTLCTRFRPTSSRGESVLFRTIFGPKTQFGLLADITKLSS